MTWVPLCEFQREPCQPIRTITGADTVMTMLDPQLLRVDTPGTAQVTHLNNAGSALPPSIVVDRQVAHLRRESEIGGYEAHAEAAEEIAAVPGSVARLMNCRPDQVASSDEILHFRKLKTSRLPSRAEVRGSRGPLRGPRSRKVEATSG